MKKILVTGASGFVGSNLKGPLEIKYPTSIIKYLDSSTDLRNIDIVDNIFKQFLPDLVINLAGKVGGIQANSLFPADFFYDNTQIGLNIYKISAKYNVSKLISLMGGCSYPAQSKSPINEDVMWDGYPQIESSGYSVAKKTYLTMTEAYKTQYNLQSIVLIPGNIYGPHDNFSLRDSHVIPAIIRKIYEANLRKEDITLFGTGLPKRDFVFISDVVNNILELIDVYNETTPINISTGVSISIKDLAFTIANLLDYRGEIFWNSKKPDGQMEKIFDITKLKNYGLSCDTSLEIGLNKTIMWFTHNYNTGLVRL